MKLTDLEPRWFSTSSDPHARHGFTFRCPHCADTRLGVAVHVDGTNFDPEPDNAQCFATGETVWSITGGSSFDDISLTPSVDASKHGGHWHGFITNGEIR